MEISVKFLRETLHTNKVFLIFLRKKLKKFSSRAGNGGKDKFLIMPSKIVADEGVGMNLPVYDFNAFLGHSRAFYGLFAGRKNWQIVKFIHPPL